VLAVDPRVDKDMTKVGRTGSAAAAVDVRRQHWRAGFCRGNGPAAISGFQRTR